MLVAQRPLDGDEPFELKRRYDIDELRKHFDYCDRLGGVAIELQSEAACGWLDGLWIDAASTPWHER